jgi:hypothetical protein
MAEKTQNTQRRGAYKEAKKPLFLEAFRKTGTIWGAARAVGISREAVYDWKENDPEFAQAFQEADEEVTELLESTAIQRAVEGVSQPVVYKGRVVRDKDGQAIEARREHSDALLMFLLRARRPEKYTHYAGDRAEHDKEPLTINVVSYATGEVIGQIK